MGGKNSTTTSKVTIPPEVLARYNAVNNYAQQVAQKPFQVYSTDPNAFVAPINATQQAGIAQTGQYANAAQPYNQQAQGYITAGGQAVNPSALNSAAINQYLSPYLSDVVGSTAALLNQNNQQQMEGQLGSAINQGAFGGDRAGLAMANLAQQQQLANANIYSNLLNQGYNTALSTAQQQQGVNLSAQQANRAATQQTGQSLASLGAAAQQEGLSGAQAQLAAGQVQQQTQQAGLSALYNQFLQQQSYPFQVAQFLGNIAEGTGALSGSTTTTTQPQSIFSDRRLKDDIEPIGKTFDGQNIVRFRYKDDPTTRIGLIAQDVEKTHPAAVGLSGAYRTVDYDKATKDAAERGHFYRGGLIAANDNRHGFAYGGQPDFLASQEAMYAPFAGGGLYGGAAGGLPRGGLSYVPAAMLPVGQLMVAQAPQQTQPSAMDSAGQIVDLANKIGDAANRPWGKGLRNAVGNMFHTNQQSQQPWSESPVGTNETNFFPRKSGGLVPFPRASGGLLPYEQNGSGLDIPDQAPQHSLNPTQPSGAQPSNALGNISSVVSIASTAAKILPFIAAAFASGGSVQGASDDEAARFKALLKSVLGPERDGGGSDDEDGGGEDQDQVAPPGASDTPTAPAMLPGLGGASPPQGGPLSPMNAEPSAGTSAPPLLAMIKLAEGTGKNPNSSARGPYQIIDPTFVGMYRQMFPGQAQGMTNAQIVALRGTPQGDQLSAEMGPVLARQNISALSDANIPPTASNVYLAHFLGPSGAIKVAQADPETPVSNLVSPAAIMANRAILKDKTAGEVRDWAASLMRRMATRLAQRTAPEQLAQAFATGGTVRRHYADGGDALDPTGDLSPQPVEHDPNAPAFPQPVAHAPDASQVPPPASAQGMAPAAQGAPTQAHGSFWSELKKPEVFIPILTGIAAMGAAPTVHPLVALAAGLGAAGQAYQGQREYQLQQARIGQQGVEAQAQATVANQAPLEAVARYQGSQAQLMEAQTQRMAQAKQLFDANYQPMPDPTSPTGLRYLNRTTGQFLNQDQYSAAWNSYLSTMLGGAAAGNAPPVPIGVFQGAGNAGGSGDIGGSVGAPVPGGGAGNLGGAPPGSGAVPAPGSAAVAPGGQSGLGIRPGGVGYGPSDNGPLGAPSDIALPPNAPIAVKAKAGFYGPPSPSAQGLDPASDPYVLMRDGQALMANPATQAIGEQKYRQGQAILTGQIPAFTAGGKEDFRFVQAQQLENTWQAQKNATMASAQNFAQSEYQPEMTALNALAKVYANGSYLNRQSGAWADFIGAVRSVPWLNGLPGLPRNLEDLQSSQDVATKNAAIQTIAQAVSTHIANKAPASALHMEGLTVPGPTLAPGARFEILGQLAGLANQQLRYYDDFLRDQPLNVPSYSNDWFNQHPAKTFIQSAYDRMPFFNGMSSAEQAQYSGGPPRIVQTPADVMRLRPGVHYVVPSGPHKGEVWVRQ